MGAASDHSKKEDVESGTTTSQNDITNPSSSDVHINNPNDILTINSMDRRATNQDDFPKLIWIDERVNLEENNFYKSYILKNHNMKFFLVKM